MDAGWEVWAGSEVGAVARWEAEAMCVRRRGGGGGKVQDEVGRRRTPVDDGYFA